MSMVVEFLGCVHTFGSGGCNAVNTPFEEVGPAPVFEAAFDGEEGVGARLRQRIQMAELRVLCPARHDALCSSRPDARRSRVFGNCPGTDSC